MSVRHIQEKVKIQLWGRAAGRCQYEGCNKILWRDELTKSEFNSAYIAHIVADKPTGPRGHETLSAKLKADISNLMLLCDTHHRLIDKEDVKGHPEERLRKMKKKHERLIELATNQIPNKQSHVLLYGAKIGQHDSPLTYKEAIAAISPDFCPAEFYPIELSLLNYLHEDDSQEYWITQDSNLKAAFERDVERCKREHDVKRFSVFALAPQPLLIRLGTLLTSLYMVEVYEHHKEPATWRWLDDDTESGYTFLESKQKHHVVALKVEVSASIDDDRIIRVLGPDCSIYSLTQNLPRLDSVRSRKHLAEFRVAVRRAFAEIKAKHGDETKLHVFPAMSPAPAVEFGRVWMPKTDLPMVIYDQNSKLGGFHQTISIINS